MYLTHEFAHCQDDKILLYVHHKIFNGLCSISHNLYGDSSSNSMFVYGCVCMCVRVCACVDSSGCQATVTLATEIGDLLSVLTKQLDLLHNTSECKVTLIDRRCPSFQNVDFFVAYIPTTMPERKFPRGVPGREVFIRGARDHTLLYLSRSPKTEMYFQNPKG